MVRIAIDPSTRDNGCLRGIPGSHRPGLCLPYLVEERQDLVLPARTDAAGFDASTAVDAELQPGQMPMHDGFMIHGARVNLKNAVSLS